MSKIYLLYTLRNQDKKFKPRRYNKAVILSYFEIFDWPETDLSSLIPDLILKFDKKDFQMPELWELLISYSEMTNIKRDFYFILPMEEKFLFKNVTSDKWVYLHEMIDENMRLKFSEVYAKIYNEVINYVDLNNKERNYPNYFSRIIERI